jgi:hypothetical protein
MFVISILTLSVFACSGGEGSNKIADTGGQPIQDVRPFNDGCILETNEGDTSIDSGEDTGDYGVDISIDTDEETQDISDISDARDEDIIGDIEAEIDYGVDRDIDTSEDVEYESDVLVDGIDATDTIDNDTGGNEVQPAPNSIIDTISLNPSGNVPGTGSDIFGAGTSSGYDYALGFAFKVSSSQKITAVEFLSIQNVAGSNVRALLYKGRKISGDDVSYWLPHYSATPEAIFDSVTPLPEPENKDPYLFRFEPHTPYTLEPDTPYVIVFDPDPDSNDQGAYNMLHINNDEGFLSATGTTDVDVFMPPFTVKRMLDVTPPQGVPYYAVWSFIRKDRRYLVRVIGSN